LEGIFLWIFAGVYPLSQGLGLGYKIGSMDTHMKGGTHMEETHKIPNP
jgi:hypothetical protein